MLKSVWEVRLGVGRCNAVQMSAVCQRRKRSACAFWGRRGRRRRRVGFKKTHASGSRLATFLLKYFAVWILGTGAGRGKKEPTNVRVTAVIW